jgi:hypothetical protein
MQKIIFTIFSVLLFFQTANSQDADTAFYVNTAFKGNERLQYKVAYGLIKGGPVFVTILKNTLHPFVYRGWFLKMGVACYLYACFCEN